MDMWPLPEGWEWVKIGDLVNVNYGDGLSQRARSGGNVPVYGANGVVGYHDIAITRGQTIIIGRKGSAGAVNWSDVPCWPIDTTFFIDEFPENIFSKFLYYSLQNRQLDRLQQSAAIPGLNRDILRNVPIPIPYPDDPARSLAEQRRIVARLEAMLSETRAMRALLQSMRRDLAALIESALAEVFPSHGQALPEGWEWRRLGYECKTTSGGTPRRSTPDYFGGSIPWVKSGELNDGIITSSEETITEQGLENSNAKIFPEGTLLMAMYGATVGKLGILGINAATNQAICAIFTPDHILNKYLFWFLRFTRNLIIRQSFGGAQPNISQVVIKNLRIPIPYPNDPARSLAEQRRIVAYLEAVQEEVSAARRQVEEDERRVTQLEQSILAAAFRGEV